MPTKTLGINLVIFVFKVSGQNLQWFGQQQRDSTMRSYGSVVNDLFKFWVQPTGTGYHHLRDAKNRQEDVMGDAHNKK